MKKNLIQSLPEPFNFYRIVLESDHLHFGLWKEDDADMTLEEAQENMFRSLLKYFPEAPAKILDVGCGLGLSAYDLAEKGYEIRAISPSPALIAYAEHCYVHKNLSFHVAGFLDEDHPVFQKEFYDLVLSQESLQYISPLSGFFQKARYLLKEKGKIIISDEVCKDISIKNRTAVHLVKDIISSLSEAGFRITGRQEVGEQVVRTTDHIIQRFEQKRQQILQTVNRENTETELDFFLKGWKEQKIWYENRQMEYHIIAAQKDNISVKPYEQGDEHRILDMFNKVFGTNRTMDHWYWKFRDNPYGRFKIAETVTGNNELAAHFCGYPVPFYYSSGPEHSECIIFHGGDTMTHPDFRHVGRGKTSILSRAAVYFYNKFCMDVIPFIYGFNTGNIRKFGERFLDYRYLPQIPFHVLDVRDFRFTPSVFHRFINVYSIEAVREISPEYDTFFQKTAPDYGTLIKRDAAYLKWRYPDCPDRIHKMYAVRRLGKLVGWGVFVQKKDSLIWGDALFDRKYPQAPAFLLNHLVHYEFPDTEKITGWFSPVPSWWGAILQDNGFQITEEPNRLAPVFTIFDNRFSLEYFERYFYYTMGDSDLF
ncbi:MAG: methyltransferase domain-containing protein [Desulfococcaceae bacterium]|jgi:cyclopropane fatty-acyl-phospholipid synthase-like methyltransferase|nr:methyltransferase domain-containing protein [Desulfococcaceae bacterium]